MMADYWIKLYLEIVEDPKMATLPDRLWRRSIELFLLAGKFGKGGALPETNQLAWVLRLPQDELEMDLRQISTTGIIEKTYDGWLVRNFAKRQAAAPAIERMRQMRTRKQKRQYYDDDNNDVTEQLRNVTQINRLTDNRLTDTYDVTELENSPLSDVFTKITGTIPYQADKWMDAEQTMNRAGVQPIDIEYAIKKMQSDDLTVAGLWSVTNTAISMKSRRESGRPYQEPKSGKRNRLPISGV